MKKLAVLLVALVGLVGGMNAQKLGHIDFQELLSLMPERQDAMNKFQQRTTDWENQIIALQKDIEMKYQEYQSNPNIPEAMRAVKEQEIMQMQQNFQSQQQAAQEDLAQYEATLLTPIFEKARTAIAAVAKANGFTYIIDSSTGATLYEGGENVLNLVLKQLGIPVPTN